MSADTTSRLLSDDELAAIRGRVFPHCQCVSVLPGHIDALEKEIDDLKRIVRDKGDVVK